MKTHIVRAFINNAPVYATLEGDSPSIKWAALFTAAEAEVIAEKRSGFKGWENRTEEWGAVSLESFEMHYASNEGVEIAVIESVSAPYGPNHTVDVNIGPVSYTFDLGQMGNVVWPECFGEKSRVNLADKVKEKSGSDFVTYSHNLKIGG